MIAWLLGVALAAPCRLDAPADAPFATTAIEAPDVRLLLELWVGAPDQVAWADEALAVLDRVGVPGVVVVPLQERPDPELLDLVARLADRPHVAALRLRAADVPTDVLAPVRPLKQRIKAYGDDRIRASYSAIGGRGSEALLGKTGFRSLVQLEAAATAVPRLAAHFEGQPRIDVVLPPGAYDSRCGPDPLVGPFTPAAADRAAEAVLESSHAATPTPVLRVALDGARQAATDAAVLERWLTEVIVPAKVQIVVPDDARVAALQGFRKGPVPDPAPGPRATGRLVPRERLQAVANQLEGLDTLPYELEGGLNPTEAFIGLLFVAADPDGDQPVRLPAVSGPATPHAGTREPAPVDAEAVRTMARRLVKALPSEIPAALPVDGQMLSAEQWLSALASVARGDDPARVQPLYSPDPNARGLGWGTTE